MYEFLTTKDFCYMCEITLFNILNILYRFNCWADAVRDRLSHVPVPQRRKHVRELRRMQERGALRPSDGSLSGKRMSRLLLPRTRLPPLRHRFAIFFVFSEASKLPVIFGTVPSGVAPIFNLMTRKC